MESNELVKEFADLLNIGSVTRDVVLAGHTVKLRTLNFDEQSRVLDGIPTDAKDIRRMDIVQKELLAAAIESIDGKKLTKEEKITLLGTGQAAFCNLIFSEYEQLLAEQSKSLEDLKKNSSAVKTAIR